MENSLMEDSVVDDIIEDKASIVICIHKSFIFQCRINTVLLIVTHPVMMIKMNLYA